jgi:hypothetical protein
MGKITMYYMKWEFGTTLCPNYNIIIVGIWNYFGKKNLTYLNPKLPCMNEFQSSFYTQKKIKKNLKTRKSMKHQEIQKILPSICQFTNSIIHQIITIGFNQWFFGDKFCQLKKTQKWEIFAFLV